MTTLLARLGVAALFALPLALFAQVTVQTPTPPRTGPQGTPDYGPPVFAELESIAFGVESYQRKHVRTNGRLDMFDGRQYFLLVDGNARVLLMLATDLNASDFMKFAGGRIEVRGIVRQVRKKQYVGPTGIDLDLVEDPTLPILPDPERVSVPKVTLTALSFSDLEPGRAGTPGAQGNRESAGQILADPGYWTGKTVRIVGLFRGRNLFGDLPADSRRANSDWVLKDGGTSVWVLDKEPRGKGWALDPSYKGDAVRWVEVVGKPEVVNGVLYLRASKLRLTKPPEEPAEEN